MEKPTRSAVDALVEKGLTVRQIANLYQCSMYRIAKIKSRKPHGWREDNEFRNPISPYELEMARRMPIGTRITVHNLHKEQPGEGISWGVREESRIVKKYPHIAVLDNGMSVDYAEIAMQMRAVRNTAEKAEGGKRCL